MGSSLDPQERSVLVGRVTECLVSNFYCPSGLKKRILLLVGDPGPSPYLYHSFLSSPAPSSIRPGRPHLLDADSQLL